MRGRFSVIGIPTVLVLSMLGAVPANAAPTVAAAVHASAASPSGASSVNVLDRRIAQPTLSAASYRAAAATPPVVIGVDNTPPPGKNWEYTHYFPETNVNVPQGGLLLFQWDQGSLNGLHTVTIAQRNETESTVRGGLPTVTTDTDNGENDVIIPPQSNNPTSFSCSTGPQAPPCSYDGTSTVSSGVIPNSVGAAFAVQLGATLAPGTYHYFCLIHPGMTGSFNVVPAAQPATDPGTLASEAASELSQLNATAAAAEAAAEKPVSTTNADGTKTWTEHVGITADDVELLEFLPGYLPIHKGDSVKFDSSATTQELHTVSTPAAGNAGLLPFLPNQCEAANGPDTLADPNVNGPPETGCADPSGFEQPFNLGTQGAPSVIPNLGTAASTVISGRADLNGLGVPATHTYTLSNNGTYVFFCFFHQNMAGAATTQGYRLGAADGGVFTQGNLDFLGSKPGVKSPVVATVSTVDEQGYWLVTADGHTYNFGDAPSVGNTPVPPASPIVGAAPAGGGFGGLWLVSKDGGVFSLGHAPYLGSLGGKHLNAPIVGIAADPSGNGYELAASDGGVFTFGTDGNGNTRFFGSLGAMHLNAPIVGISSTINGDGYYLVARDGGVFTFGDAKFAGSLGATHLNAPIVGIAATGNAPTLNGVEPGYRLVASDGGVFAFNASFQGSLGAIHLNSPIVGITGNSG